MAPRGGQACRWATAAAARRVLEGLSQPYDAWTQEGALPLPLPGLPYSEREAEVGSPSKTVLMTPSKSVILLSSVETPMLPEIFVVNDYIASWIATVGAIAALRRRATEGGSYRVNVSLACVSLWLLRMGIFTKDYARK